MADYSSNKSPAHSSGKSSPQGYYGPPVPAQFISSNQQDGMQPLALVKRVTGPPPSSSHSTASSPGQNIPSQPPVLRPVDPATNPKVIVTTRTPIFIKSSSHVSPIPRQAVMAHTQSTQSIAAVRPSLVMNPPHQMPPALVRIPSGSPRLTQLRPSPTHVRPNLTQVRPGLTQVRPGTNQVRPGLTQVRPGLTQIRSGLQLRHIYPSPRIPLQRGPPPTSHLQPLRTPPPHRSPKLQLTPPVAHMVNRTPPMSVRTSHSPFPAHTRKVPAQRVRSPPSTQQVRPMIINTNSGPMIRPVLTIPGTPQRIQATLGAIQSSQVTLKSPKGHMVIAQSSKSPSGSTVTQLSQSNARPVFFAPRQLLPANLKNQPYQVGKKVLVAVNPHGMKQSQAVKIQAKPVSAIPATSTVGGTVTPVVTGGSPSQILVPLHTGPSRKLPYTGKKRGRKKGSKNKPKVGQGIKIRILPTTAVHGIPQKPQTSKESAQPEKRPEPAPVAPPVIQESATPTPTEEAAPSLPEEPTRPKPLEEKGVDKPASEIPKAVVKPTILTHVIDGFIIEESKEPFPMPENNSMQLAVNADGSRTTEEPRGLKRGAQDSWEPSPGSGYLRCEFCGKTDFPRKFKRSKRFCSMACAKRYNVGCTKRLGLFSPKEEKPTRVKHKMKLQGPKAKPLKGARGKYGRLKFNVTQPWNSKTKIVYKAISGTEGPPSTSEESHSSSSSNAAVSPLIREPDSMPFPEEVDNLPAGLTGDPGSWSVTNVRDFIRSVPGCNDFAEEFYSQEIDGQALMLLKEDHLMTTMNMKLGPALKIISKINTLREKPVVLQS